MPGLRENQEWSGTPRKDLYLFCMCHERVHLVGDYITKNITNRLKTNSITIAKKVMINGSESLTTEDIWGMIDYKDGDGIVITTVDHNIEKIIVQSLQDHKVNKFDIFIQKIITDDNENLFTYKYKHISSPTGYYNDYTLLEKLGEKYNTDKISGKHNFLNKYEFFLSRFKNSNIRLVILGTIKGASANMWRDYFTKADIYVVDSDENNCRDLNPGINAIIMDPGSQESFDKIKIIKPDVLIDDGSHLWGHQLDALFSIFPTMPSGSVYIVESIHTSFPPFDEMGYANRTVSPFTVCQAISEAVSNQETVVSLKGNEALNKYIDMIERIALNTEMISFIAESCIIVKK